MGMATFYYTYKILIYRYATWLGKALYLEDLVVYPEYRSLGIGTTLFESVTHICEVYLLLFS